jgi:hypothetical protein
VGPEVNTFTEHDPALVLSRRRFGLSVLTLLNTIDILTQQAEADSHILDNVHNELADISMKVSGDAAVWISDQANLLF